MFVYQCFDRDAALLYVGISGIPLKRLTEHGRAKPWFTEVVTVTLEHYPDRERAAQREAELIHSRHPRYNKHDNHPRYAEPYIPLIASIAPKRPTSRSAKQTHCIHGHLYDSLNTLVTKQGYRQCRACIRLRREAQRVS